MAPVSLVSLLIHSIFPLSQNHLLTMNFQGWLLKYRGDLLPVTWCRFHLFSGMELHSRGTQQRKRRKRRKKRSDGKAAESGTFLADHFLLKFSSSRCQAGIPHYGCKFYTTDSCLITLNLSFCSFTFLRFLPLFIAFILFFYSGWLRLFPHYFCIFQSM